MALTSNQYSVTSTPTLLVDQSPSGVRVTLHNLDQGNPVYINGASSVSTVTGFRIDAKQIVQFDLNPSEQLWGVTSPNTSSTVAIIRQTQYA